MASWHEPHCAYAFMHDQNVLTFVKDWTHYCDKRVLLWNLFVCWLSVTWYMLHYYCHTHYNIVNTTVEVHKSLGLQHSNFQVCILFTLWSQMEAEIAQSLYWLHNGLDDCGLNPSTGNICLYPKASRVAPGPTQPTLLWVPGASLMWVKWERHETDLSPPTVLRQYMTGAIYTSILPPQDDSPLP